MGGGWWGGGEGEPGSGQKKTQRKIADNMWPVVIYADETELI